MLVNVRLVLRVIYQVYDMALSELMTDGKISERPNISLLKILKLILHR